MIKIVSIREGREGPPADPYAYREYKLIKDGLVALLHLGLDTWFQVGDRQWIECETSRFKLVTGLTVAQVEKAFERLHPWMEDTPPT